MSKGRVEAFSDGVLAVIITIMVLEMKSPHGTRLAALRPLIPVFLTYVLSFVYIGIYWNNHHHLLHATQRVNGATLWANMHLLFWISLVPFTTAWMGENHFSTWPVALYGIVLLLAAAAYLILTRALITLHGPDSTIATSIGRDMKGKISFVIYAAAIPLAFVQTWAACACYIVVAVVWLKPDRRIERALTQGGHEEPRQ
ncbi:MAG: TMEM175 family protein [Terriglobia bacterium]